MKKFLFFLLGILLFSFGGYSQLMQASIGPGSTTNAVKIYIKADVSQPSATIFTLQFNIGIDPSISPRPTASVVTNPSFGATWIIDPSYVEGGYTNYNIYTATSPIIANLTANTEVEVMEISFSGGFVVNSNNVSLVCLADGGTTTGNALFYCTGSINSDGHSNLYYPRAGVTVNNQFSYDNPTFALAGTTTSTATLNAGVLPVKLTNFSAIKKNNDAVLNWQVSNQDANSSYFELLRSFNGTDFKKVGRVDVNLSSGLAGSYSFTDLNAAASKANIIYYRLRMVDKDERSTLSSIKNIRLTKKSFSVDVYPNPARQFSTVNIDLENGSSIILSLTDAAGKVLQKTQFNGFKGLNQKQIDLSKFASGSYLLKVNSGNENQTISIIKE